MPKVAIYTLGCKVNQYESEGILEIFRQNEYEIVTFDDFADVYIINTCTVTNVADRKSRQMIRQAKKRNNDSIVVAMGCYTQISPKEVEKIKDVDLIIGTKDKTKIIKLIEEFKTDNKRINIVEDIMKYNEFEKIPFTTKKDKTRAFLKIQDGCNNFCTYCIIPYTRGPIRSRRLDDIVSEVEELSKQGFLEIVLTGIHVESYGRDFDENIDLVDVVNAIDKIDGIKRIRLSSVEPKLISNKFIEKLESEKLCSHFHLSLQSGCDETLKRMNRRYDTTQYKKAVDLLRNNFKDVSITTDIIVGFPGETDKEFNLTLDYVREIKFSQIHVFKYSARKGTKAAQFDDQVDSKIKDERSKKLMKIANKLQIDYYKRFIGQTKEVLFEQRVKNNKEYIEGLTDNYLRVFVNTHENLIGQIRNVKFIEYNEEYLLGVIE